MKQRYVYTQTITTAADGSATVYFGYKINGRVVAIKYMPGSSGLDTGADLTLTGEDSAVPILVKANAGTSTVWYYPRVLVNKNTDASAGTDAFTDIYVYKERIKLVVAQGGNVTTGSMTIYTEEDQ
jgi:hypothetical protein